MLNTMPEVFLKYRKSYWTVGCIVASEQLFREVDKLFKPTR